MQHVSTATDYVAAAALTQHVEPSMAGEALVEGVADAVGAGVVDLAVLFVSGRHVEEMEHLADQVRAALDPGTLLGVSAESVVGGDREVERRAAASLFVTSLPGTRIHGFQSTDLPHVAEDDEAGLEDLAGAMGLGSDSRLTVLFADPFSVPAAAVVERMSDAGSVVDGLGWCPVVGGMASASPAPGGNVLVLNDHVGRAGAVGVTISGDVGVDTLVSQGCRPIGRPLVITEAHRNIISGLSGRTAMEALHDTVTSLDPEDRELLPNGVFLGRVINEYKDRFGRGDFLIRGITKIDPSGGRIIAGDLVRTGQTVQFHLRDAETAREDLELLLEAQRLRGRPLGGLLFTCNGRGTRLFGEESHDARRVASLFGGGGVAPLAGCSAAGEIGPIGRRSFLHGHTAVGALLRAGSGG